MHESICVSEDGKDSDSFSVNRPANNAEEHFAFLRQKVNYYPV